MLGCKGYAAPFIGKFPQSFPAFPFGAKTGVGVPRLTALPGQGDPPAAAPCPSHPLPVGTHTLSVPLFGDQERQRGIVPFHGSWQQISRDLAGVKRTLIHPLSPERSAISISLL